MPEGLLDLRDRGTTPWRIDHQVRNGGSLPVLDMHEGETSVLDGRVIRDLDVVDMRVAWAWLHR
jgi:hypothetical protein